MHTGPIVKLEGTLRDASASRPSAAYWDGTRHRGRGLEHIPGLYKMNGVYGTGRDFPIYGTPGINSARDFEQAADYAAMNQADLSAWLNFERAHADIRHWGAEDWQIWSYHMRAAWTRRLDDTDQPFDGCMLLGASPDRNTWYTIQWNNTHAIRIPNLVWGSLYTGPWQEERFKSLQVSRANGYDIICCIGIEDQTTSPSQPCTWRAFSEQVKLAARIIEQVPNTDRVGEVSIVLWDHMVGHPRRSSNEDWTRAMGYATSLVTQIPAPPASSSGSSGSSDA